MVEFQWLGASSHLLIRCLLILWIIAVAIECGDLTKRDGVHRIVLRTGKIPKSHKHHHHHSYRSDQEIKENKLHKHRFNHEAHTNFNTSTYISHEENRESKNNRRPDYKRKRHSVESTEKSSRENSFEENCESIRPKKERPVRQNYHRFHKFHADIDAGESRLTEPSKINYRMADNWATNLYDVPSSPEINPKKKKKKNKISHIDFTTSVPVKPSPSFQFAAYGPPYSSLPTLSNLPLFPNTFEYHKKTDYVESQPLSISPQLPVLQPKPINQFTNLLPIQTTFPFKLNLSNNYEVNEKGVVDIQPTSSPTNTDSFQKVIPISFLKTISHVNSTTATALHPGIVFKDDIKKHAPTHSLKRKLRINGNK